MTKLTFTIIFLCVISFPAICLAEDEAISKEQLTQYLDRYLNLETTYPAAMIYMNPIVLKNEDIDPIPFAIGLTSDIQYCQYWKDGLELYVAAMYREKKFYDLADRLIEWLERKEDTYSNQVIEFKLRSLNYLEQLVGPNFFQDALLKKKILAKDI